MRSAFGVEHTFSKAMSGKELKALLATRNRGTGRAREYADARLQQAQGKTGKSTLQAAIRTPRGLRDANRKGIFG